jgi:hypothetical protein
MSEQWKNARDPMRRSCDADSKPINVRNVQEEKDSSQITSTEAATETDLRAEYPENVILSIFVESGPCPRTLTTEVVFAVDIQRDFAIPRTILSIFEKSDSF